MKTFTTIVLLAFTMSLSAQKIDADGNSIDPFDQELREQGYSEEEILYITSPQPKVKKTITSDQLNKNLDRLIIAGYSDAELDSYLQNLYSTTNVVQLTPEEYLKSGVEVEAKRDHWTIEFVDGYFGDYYAIKLNGKKVAEESTAVKAKTALAILKRNH